MMMMMMLCHGVTLSRNGNRNNRQDPIFVHLTERYDMHYCSETTTDNDEVIKDVVCIAADIFPPVTSNSSRSVDVFDEHTMSPSQRGRHTQDTSTYSRYGRSYHNLPHLLHHVERRSTHYSHDTMVHLKSYNE
jgi:hypothetical protein